METSLTEIKKHFPIGEGFIKILLNEAAARIQAQGCVLTVESGMAKKIYDREIKSPSSPGGSIARVGQLLPILNSNITCP